MLGRSYGNEAITLPFNPDYPTGAPTNALYYKDVTLKAHKILCYTQSHNRVRAIASWKDFEELGWIQITAICFLKP